MKILSWNCRSLGSPCAVQALLRLKMVENPDVLFLMETKLKKEEVQSIKFKSGFNGCFIVECKWSGRDRAGGLILMWKDSFLLKILSYFENHIGGVVGDEVDNQDWFLYGVYGYPEEHKKRFTWDLIQNLVGSGGDLVLYFGDLNDITSEQEKMGGNSRSLSQLSLGRQTMELYGLSDLGFQVHPYTWSNGRKGNENIQCRLDRALASPNLQNRFSPIKVIHLPRFVSDHAVVRIDMEADLGANNRRRRHIFRFEEAWCRDMKCEAAVREMWDSQPGNGVSKIAGLKSLDEVFKDYKVNAVKQELKRIEILLKEDSNWKASEEAIAIQKTLEAQRNNLLQVEEIIWRQKSIVVWLQYGDKNSKFFHKKDNHRRQTNLISKLKDEAGYWWRGEDNVERLMVSYFSNLFSSSMHENIEEDVCNLVLEILNKDRDPRDINNTHTILIPKYKNHATPKDFRPISLCNVVMKMMLKTIANRIKKILPDIVDEEQSGFVSGRLITDNALVSMECFHWQKKKNIGKKGMMALKYAKKGNFGKKDTWKVVNLDKSEVSFSQNVCEEDKDMIRARMGVKAVTNHKRYLGLPVIFGRSKKEIFSLVVERFWKKIKGWKEQFLSRARKEVLIKAAAQAIPTYVMNCYKLP
ncbi:uncharacterized protein LOC131618873 [Vicia villosa]|uniref:uncharacterized protein LOC131618873 n=1 Tax=Vicia villosa TaxID=3911 RepID=UPI00273BF3E8|nr:uncharacterized protein LOC131618873 [Vicia villosa]